MSFQPAVFKRDQSVYDILTYPNPVLKEHCQPVAAFGPELRGVLDKMLRTMYAGDGIGLAAPQVGILERLVVIDISPERREPFYFVNPQIISQSGTSTFEEGCLSIPDYRDTVKRSAEVTVQAQDADGKEFELSAAGLLAICIQHEFDHLDGILFTDRLSRLKREIFKRWSKKRA